MSVTKVLQCREVIQDVKTFTRLADPFSLIEKGVLKLNKNQKAINISTSIIQLTKDSIAILYTVLVEED